MGEKTRWVLVAAAGAGKDFLRNKMVARGLVPDISVTTRPPRKGEADGKDYYFISEVMYRSLKEANMLYEAVTFNGWHYGTLQKSWEESDVFIMTPSGVKQISPEERKNCFVIYLDIPEDIRRSRIAMRSDADSVERRIEADRKDFAEFTDFDMRIDNANF